MQFDDQLVVDAISLSVPAGTILGIIGPSGAGKTTLIRLMTGGTDADVRPSVDPRRGPEPVPPPDPRADRLHAPVVHPLPGPDGPRERRLRRIAVRDAVPLAPTADARGPRAARPVGPSEVGAPAGCPAACSGGSSSPARSSTTRPCCSSTSRRRASIPSSGRGSGTSSIACATSGRTLLVTTQYVNEAEECDQVAMIVRRPAHRPRDARMSFVATRWAATSSSSRPSPVSTAWPWPTRRPCAASARTDRAI